ncbi:Probable septum site-determining protein minC [hydrothermal vent metagenome]|uniref:Probable septum site-determining protein minC n=1 Tax=hydrothermal vent metagenome TaxID=652676 RepID=A0A1W1C9N7_9ZZZZ
MKGKQYSVKVYETTIDDEDRFISFFDANYLLFKDRLIVLNGTVSSRIEEFLEKKGLKYITNIELPKSNSRKETDLELIKAQEKREQFRENLAKENQALLEEELDRLSDRLQNNLTVLDSIVRSGREINLDGDLLLLNRVNSGATLNIEGNLIVTQVVEGSIRCNGNFMMLNNSPKANIIFHGVEVDNSLLEDRLNRIELIGDEIVITPVLKKEINWA